MAPKTGTGCACSGQSLARVLFAQGLSDVGRISGQVAELRLLSAFGQAQLPPNVPDATPLSGRARPSGPENMPFENPYSLPFIAAKAEGLDADPVARHGWLSLGV